MNMHKPGPFGTPCHYCRTGANHSTIPPLAEREALQHFIAGIRLSAQSVRSGAGPMVSSAADTIEARLLQFISETDPLANVPIVAISDGARETA